MQTEQAAQLFKCLSDPSRLSIVSALSGEPMHVERLAERLGLSSSTVSFHLKKLQDAGLVDSQKEQYYAVYRLKTELLTKSVLSLLPREATEQEKQLAREEAARRKVLSTFFVDGRLTAIPVQRKKRRVILEEIASRFEPGKRYPEREVNLIISEMHDDFCTLRRELICEGLMERDHGVYWRTQAD